MALKSILEPLMRQPCHLTSARDMNGEELGAGSSHVCQSNLFEDDIRKDTGVSSSLFVTKQDGRSGTDRMLHNSVR